MTSYNVACAAFSLTLLSVGALTYWRKTSPIQSLCTTPEWLEVLQFWFEGEGAACWFLSEGPARDEIDSTIQKRFGRLVEACVRGEKDAWFNDGCKGALALIILLDQFTRHVYRGDDARIALFGAKARTLTEMALERGDHELVRGDELGFLLMPFRHEKPVSLERLERVLSIVDARERRAIKEKAALSRFKRVTESRLSEARADYEKLHMEIHRQYKDEDILEPFPEVSSDSVERLSDESRSPVWKVMERYLAYHGKENRFIIVSLSGGVDSMVLMTILKNIIDKQKLDITVVAAHVDYGNRGESHAEAAFVHRYSAMLDIDCHVHRIEGLLRGVTDREEYEARSRELRFDLYKRVWSQLNAEGSPIVLFGHHEGDVVENVLSNAMKGKTILELSGMTEESVISGCTIRRPLLPLTKDPVLDYAHRFKVPYFKDTTPRWSTRGQVRMEVLPCLERVYGRGFSNHLAHLAEQSDEAFALLSRDFFQGRVLSSPQLREVRTLPFAFAFDLTESMSSKPLFLWRLALRKASHDHGVLTPTDKAVKFLYDAVSARQQSGQIGGCGWFAELRRGCKGYVWNNRYLMVMRYDQDLVLPYHENILIKENDPVMIFGGWNVQIHLLGEDEGDIETITMDDIWQYFVHAPVKKTSFSYAINASEDHSYKLTRSQHVIQSLQVDIALRGAVLPLVFPVQPFRAKNSRKAVVKITWIL